MNKLKKYLKFLGKTALALTLGILLVYSVLNFVWGRTLERRIAQLKAEGKPVSLADLKGPDIPDEENGAVVYEKIFALLPEVSQEEQNKHYSRITHMSPEELRSQPEVVEDARRQLALREQALALVEEAISKPKCRFEADWENAPQMQRPSEYYADLRELARLLSARATLQAYDGNMGEALKDVDLVYKLNNSLQDEPATLGFLVRVAMLSMAGKSLQNIPLYGDVDERQAKHLFDQLGEINLQQSFLRTWETERVLGLHGYETFRHQLHWIPTRRDEIAYLDLIGAQIDGTRLSYSEAKSKGLLGKDRPIPSYAGVAATIVPILAKATERRYAVEAELAGTRTLLALHTYRSVFGSYPRTLEELESGLGWTLPKDPLSEKGLVYKRQETGFLLYSRGLDMKDDGGKQDKQERGPDIVWKSDR